MKTNKLSFLLLFLILIGNVSGKMQAQISFTNAQYAEALQKSIFFYEAQQSGALPTFNRVKWRANSALTDGSDVGKNLTGGWYDAGDHVKFGFPMAFSATMLGWGALDFKSGYEKSGQLTAIKNNLKFVYDYLIKCHTAPNELYGQIGSGGLDHSFWGAPEIMTMARPSYKIDATHPGTDLAMETAAALAAGSMIFATDDPAYSATLLQHAKELYNFGNTYRGKYSDAITDAAGFYNSWSGYNDELVWGALWLYRATNDNTYLTNAENAYNSLSFEGQSTTNKAYKWTINWDDKTYGCYALLAKLTGKTKYYQDMERNLDFWTTGVNGEKVAYTPGGLAWLQQWGSLRYASNASFLALYYGDLPLANTAKIATYKNFAKTQINYALGANPGSRSYVCGFGNNPPINPHHRGAHGTWNNNLTGPPTNSRHTLYGALVGGPGADDSYSDDRGNFVTNEVATDYNAGFSGALARIMADATTAITPPVVPNEVVGEEYIASIKSNSTGSNFFEPAVRIQNHTAWPARKPTKLSFRYFIDISEGVSAGFTISNYSIVLGGYAPNATLVPGFKLWTGNIYYAEVEYNNVAIYPGGQSESQRECQFRMTGPTGTWNSSNDFSFTGVTNIEAQTLYVPVYENGVLVYGNEPPRTTVNYIITATAGANGTITPDGVSTVAGGSNKTYTITPNAGYIVDAVTVNGTSVGAVTTYTFSNVTGNKTISATFKLAPTYTITATAGANGTISSAGVSTVASGSSKTFTMTPNAGYVIDTVTVNGTSVGNLSTYTFTNVNANQTIAVTFKVPSPTYTITASAGANGSISSQGISSVISGSSKTYTMTPNAGYVIDTVTVNGTLVGSLSTYTFTNITANQTIAVTFKVSALTYTITASAGANGTISPLGVSSVGSGGSKVYTMTPNIGYAIDTVTVDGVSVGSVGTYTFTNVTANKTISVTFKTLTVGGCLLARFGVPRTTALPDVNNLSFNKVYTLGTATPNLSNVTNAVLNWSLSNNGLWQLSFNTSNGIPTWWLDMRNSVQNFAQAQPAITFNGTGIPNLDGNKYFINIVDSNNIVFVEVTGKHAIYFSNSATVPVGCAAARFGDGFANSEIKTYPNPANDFLNVIVSGESKSKEILIYDLFGKIVFQKTLVANAYEEAINMSKLPAGLYKLIYISDAGFLTTNVMKQ
jgi:Glycosyl hydrolase family 9/Cellulose binding domain/Secretion system C-terminal sorting domain/Divergent InlB B-repeat domain